MDENNQVKPTMENTNPFHWEMQLLAQQFNEREARQVASNDSYLADQENLREHNHNVAKLEERKRAHLAILDADQESEIDLINQKYLRKFHGINIDYTNQRDALETELFKKSGKSYKKLQKLHTQNLSQSQEFERKAKDILQRMAHSLREENTICVLDTVRKTSTAIAEVETPPVSSASGATTPVSQAERIFQNQYLEASPSEIQPLLDGGVWGDVQPVLENGVWGEMVCDIGDTPPLGDGLSAPTPPSAQFVFRAFPDNHPMKRQKTNEASYNSAKNNSTSSRNGAPRAHNPLRVHIPMQSSSMALEETFDSHAKSSFSSTNTSGQDIPRTPAPAQYHNFSYRVENPLVVAMRHENHTPAKGKDRTIPTRSSSIKISNREPTRETASVDYTEFDEMSDISYPNVRSTIPSRVSSTKNSGKDLTRTQETAQYYNLSQRAENFSTQTTKPQERTSNGESYAFPQNASMSTLPISKDGSAHSQEPLDGNLVFGGYIDFPPAAAQVANRSHASSQATRPLESAAKRLVFKDGLSNDASDMEEESQSSNLNGRNATPFKRKASDINMDGPSEDVTMSNITTPIPIKQEHKGSSRTKELRRSSTNHTRLSNGEPEQSVNNASQPSNANSTRRTSNVRRVTTPRSNNAEPAQRVTSASTSMNSASIRPGAITYKPSNAESQLSIVFFSIEFMSYDPGWPSKCYPVKMNGSHNYRLQVMQKKNRILHPYDGTENKSSLYPKLVIDNSWILGGFYDKQINNHRLEIYRPRCKKEYPKMEVENNADPAAIESARMRIKFIDGVELERFLEWYRGMHPDAEIRPNDLLGKIRNFIDKGSDSTLRKEIENRARRIALVAPIAPMTPS